MDQRDNAEQDEEQTDNDDRSGASFHAEETNVTASFCKATRRRHPGPATPGHHPRTLPSEKAHQPPSSFHRSASVVHSPGMLVPLRQRLHSPNANDSSRAFATGPTRRRVRCSTVVVAPRVVLLVWLSQLPPETARYFRA